MKRLYFAIGMDVVEMESLFVEDGDVDEGVLGTSERKYIADVARSRDRDIVCPLWKRASVFSNMSAFGSE